MWKQPIFLAKAFVRQGVFRYNVNSCKLTKLWLLFFFPLKNLNGASHQNSEQKSKGSKQIVFFKDSNKRRNTLVNSYFMFDYPNFFFLFGQYYPNFIFFGQYPIFF